MEFVEYKTRLVGESWSLPQNPQHPHRKVEYGFWIRETKDRVISQLDFHLRSGDSDGERLYQYGPLQEDEFRILTLEPGLPFEPVIASLRVASLHNRGTFGSYDAISYAWGSAREFFRMRDSSSISVPPNAIKALKGLRSPNVSRALWIDSLCINQNLASEKNIQVIMFMDIFATAERVFVWLGESSAVSDVGMEVLEHFAKGGSFDASAPWRRLPIELVKAGLDDILTRPWWKRYWVVQEAAVAREVVMVCGSKSFSWKNDAAVVQAFLRSLKVAVISPQWAEAGLDEIETDNLVALLHTQLDSRSQDRQQSGWNILDVAHAMRRRQAGDPRDRLYSLAGIAGRVSGESVTITPDYTLSVEQTFDQFVRQITTQPESHAMVVPIEVRSTYPLIDPVPPIQRDQAPNSSTVELSPPRTSTDASALEGLVQLVCAEATQNIRNGNFIGAASILQVAQVSLQEKADQSIS